MHFYDTGITIASALHKTYAVGIQSYNLLSKICLNKVILKRMHNLFMENNLSNFISSLSSDMHLINYYLLHC